jgi:NAD(P)-dependent dehydrogenase (short-subunit alcohol dehydrogenase family)
MVEKVDDINLNDVESTFQSNIIAMIAMAKYAVPHMKRGSAIVNSTSVTAFKGSFGFLRAMSHR